MEHLPAATAKLRSLQHVLAARTVSGAFSGVETPTTGGLHMANAFAARSGTGPCCAKHLWVIEWNADAIQELLVHPGLGDDCCVFGNIMDFVNPAYAKYIAHLKTNPHLAVDVLGDVVKSGSLCKLSAYCHRHKQQCRIRPTHLHAAGTPCTPFSTQGAQNGNDDPCVLFLLVWMALMNKILPEGVLQENVSGFISSLLSDLMGHNYNVQWYVTDTPEYGWPGHRLRKYHGLTRKHGRGGGAVDGVLPIPMSTWMRLFHRVCNVSHDVFWCAPKPMLHEFLSGLMVKRKVPHCDVDPDDNSQWASCLLTSQHTRLARYRAIAPRACYSLQQAPEEDARGHGAHSDANGYLHTMIKNCLPLWVDSLEIPRLCHPYEIAGTQGLYIFERERLALWPGSPQRKLSSFDCELKGRKMAKVGEFAGNAMNAHVISVALLWLLLVVDWSESL